MPDLLTKKLKIFGYVQGVGFRYSMVARARDFGVTGWVKNCDDGTVEALVQGDSEQVAAIIEWANKGPTGGRVERVDVTEGVGIFSEFSIC